MNKFIIRIVPIIGLIVTTSLSLFTVAMANEPTTLTIERTWDDLEIGSNEQATLSLNWLESGDLEITIDSPFANEGPPQCETLSCWKLWEYEVIELFILGSGDPVPYTEIEVSPYGNYLVLQLLGSRNVIAKELPLDVSELQRTETRWSAKVTLDSELIPQGDLTVNAYRVFGLEPNRRHHVMTPVGGEQPDFHRIEEFKMVVDRP